MKPYILHIENLDIGYADRRQQVVVAADVNAGLVPGELVCLLGPNGAGKSTLLRTMAGMQRPLQGAVYLDGRDIHQLDARTLARRLSMVLTERVQAGMLTAYALVALGRHPYTDWAGRLTAVDEQIVQWALTAVGAQTLAHRFVPELSDGERQKVMIARALAQQPQVMLLDEPTAFLDLPHRVEIMGILRQLAHTEKRAILLSTHDLDLALRLADKVWLLPQKGRSWHGRFQVGTPEDLVLSGAFSEAFQSAGIRFDPLTGSFQLPPGEVGQVDLVGDGLGAVWARRALEREGFQVHQGANGAAVRIKVLGDNGRYHWQLSHQQHTTELASIQSLVEALKETQT